MVKVGSSAIKGKVNSTTKTTSGIKSGVKPEVGTSKLRVKGSTVKAQHKDTARKTGVAGRNKLSPSPPPNDKKRTLSPVAKVKAKQLVGELKSGEYKFPKQVKPKSRSKEGTYGYPYQKARKEFLMRSLADPSVGKDIKGWITQEILRSGKSGYWRSPPGVDIGHRVSGRDKSSNLRFENRQENRSRGGKHKR